MPDPRFLTTRWSVVVQAGAATGPGQQAALSALCETYWYPIYAFARRKGNDVETACDLVQSFFLRLMEGKGLARADAERGRFRSYLLGAFVHFLADEWDRSTAAKRGGDRTGFSLDQARAEGRFAEEPVDDGDPEQIFQRSWARTLLEEVVARLDSEYEASGKAELFAVLRPTLMGEASSYRELAEQVGTTEGAVKVAAYRLRQRFGQLLRREIAGTLEDPEDVDDEIRGLFQALEGGIGESL